MNPISPSEISDLVRSMLENRNKTEFAERVGISRQQLYRYQKGDAVPTLDELNRMAELTGNEITIVLNQQTPQIAATVERNAKLLRLLIDMAEEIHGANHPRLRQMREELEEKGHTPS